MITGVRIVDSVIKRVNGGELCAKNQTWLQAYIDKIENNNTSTDTRDESTKELQKARRKSTKNSVDRPMSQEWRHWSSERSGVKQARNSCIPGKFGRSGK
jgi:hypothetical protein